MPTLYEYFVLKKIFARLLSRNDTGERDEDSREHP